MLFRSAADLTPEAREAGERARATLVAAAARADKVVDALSELAATHTPARALQDDLRGGTRRLSPIVVRRRRPVGGGRGAIGIL